MTIAKYQWLIINSLGLLLLGFVITDPFELKLVFLDTTLTGGDGGSWHQIALHLKESLLPHGRLFGWDQGNFFGYANLQHYFVLPFLIPVLLSYLIPLSIALKIITLLGFFTLPFAVYWMLRKLRYETPYPLAGAWLTLIFLFHERYSMFGGNLLSTLAGEFSYSFAFTIMVIFLGLFYKDVQNGNLSPRSGIVLGIIGLSHAFVFFVSLFIPLFFLFKNPTQKSIRLILITYLFGFLIMAFWVLPMLASLPFTTPINLTWRFSDISEFLNNIHYEVLLIAFVFGLGTIFKRFRSQRSLFLAYMIAVSVVLYLIATALHIPDIRFFPPLLFFSLLFILDGFVKLIALGTQNATLAKISILGLCFVLGGSWVYDEDNNSPEWFKWNYSGFELKPAFTDGRAYQLFSSLKGDYSDPRVAWEQGDHTADFGTNRVFENIPLFTGRASTEGIHYASALLSLPITLFNGEYSKIPASPSANIYSHYFIDSLPQRFDMFNIRDFIAFSPEITELMRESSEFELVKEAPPYTLFRWKNHNTDYIATPQYRPLITEDYADWKRRFKNWFRRGENNDLTLINGSFDYGHLPSEIAAQSRVSLDTTGKLEDELVRSPLEPATVSQENITNFQISFVTNKPNTPHVIKIAYSPNWKSKNNEPIYMIAPGLMLIYPETNQVNIDYERHWSEIVGIFLTLGGIMLAIFLKYNKYAFERHLSNGPYVAVVNWILAARKPLLGFLLLATALVSIWSYQAKHHIYADLIAGNKLQKDGKLHEAVEKYQQAATLHNIKHVDNVDVPISLYAMARMYRQLEEYELAKQAFETLLEYYPRWIYIDEIYWHLGSIALAEDRYSDAEYLFNQCIIIEKIGVNADRCRQDLQIAQSKINKSTE